MGQGTPVPASTFKRDKREEGFKAVKCRWNKCRGTTTICDHIRVLGGINVIDREHNKNNVKGIQGKGALSQGTNGTTIGEALGANGYGERQWFREAQKGYEVDLAIDSGAVATITPMGTVPGEAPRETEASRRKMAYQVVNRAAIINRGEVTLRGKAPNGVSMNVIAQVSEVTKPLAAVREIIKGGSRVVMDEEGSYIENKKNGKRIPIKRDNDMFVVTMTLPKGEVRAMENHTLLWRRGIVRVFTGR